MTVRRREDFEAPLVVVNAPDDDADDVLRPERVQRRGEALERWKAGASPMAYEDQCTFEGEDGKGPWPAQVGRAVPAGATWNPPAPGHEAIARRAQQEADAVREQWRCDERARLAAAGVDEG